MHRSLLHNHYNGHGRYLRGAYSARERLGRVHGALPCCGLETFQGRDRETAEESLLFYLAHFAQVDAIVTSVNAVGFFADAGPLPLFVSSHVSI